MLHHNNLEIQQREREGIAILDLHGKLVMGGGDIALRDCVQSLFDPGNRQLILDLAKISEIDTSGIGVLLLLAEQYRNGGGKLVLFNVAHAHGEVYEMARLESGDGDLSRRAGCRQQLFSRSQNCALRHSRLHRKPAARGREKDMIQRKTLR